MKVGEIITKLEAEYPPQLAMAWDNPGLQVGRTDRTVSKIYVALDATDAVIRDCISWGAELLVTHHPLLMAGIKKVNSEEYPGRKALELAEHRIAHYAMHTNYDVTKMSELAERALRLQDVKILEVTGVRADGSDCGIGGVGYLPERMTAQECCEYVKKSFGLAHVRLFGDPQAHVRYAAVSPGSGKSMIAPALAAGAEVLITGDIGHHDGLDAVDQGLTVIDAGHYGVEQLFIRQTAAGLRLAFPGIEVREAGSGEPFTVV